MALGELRNTMGGGGDIDDSGREVCSCAISQGGLEKLKEEELTQIIDGKVHFMTIFGSLQSGHTHNSSIVDENIDSILRSSEYGPRSIAHTLQRRVFHLHQRDIVTRH